MNDQNPLIGLREPLATARSVFIYLPPNPVLDQVAASLGLSLSLTGSQKAATVFCPTPMRVEFSDVIGLDRIKKEPSSGSLTVAFDYLEDSIEKVSYHIENNKFNLVIQPKPGQPPLNRDKVEYHYSGSKPDFIFSFGAQAADELSDFFWKKNDFLTGEKMANLSLDPQTKKLGKYDLIFPGASSFSEIVVHLVSQLRLSIDQDAATNLLMGIDQTTKSLSSARASLSTFEAVVYCLRVGGRRSQATVKDRPSRRDLPSSRKHEQSIKPGPLVKTKMSDETVRQQDKPSPDWFEPKIYQGSTKI